MRFVTSDDIDEHLSFPALVDALADAFVSPFIYPTRHHHTIRPNDPHPATLLLMPAWTGPGMSPAFTGVKVVAVHPDNASASLPTVIGSYLLMDGNTGQPLAALDGSRLTIWRTAAASALAARYLARTDSRRLVMIGAGALAPFLIRAHMSQRPIDSVSIWSRRAESAESLARALQDEGISASSVSDLETAVNQADIVSTATLSDRPIVKGAWLKKGAHIDLVGAFNLTMREADDEALRSGRIHIDTDAALTEGGDVALALASGAISKTDICGTLADLCNKRTIGRDDSQDITVFKSVGAALEDLAAAILVWRSYCGKTCHTS